jgi:hypothetical protein
MLECALFGLGAAVWIVVGYVVFAFLLVGSAAWTAMWHPQPARRRDAFKVYKLALALLTSTSGIVGLVFVVHRIGLI